jgi:hypothetical protein
MKRFARVGATILAAFPILIPVVPAHADAISDITQALSAPVAVTLHGKPVDISQTAGWKVVYFWSSTCPCVKACERYSFIPLENAYAGRVTFYAIASDGYDLNLPRPTLTNLILSHHLPYTLLLDTNHCVAKYYKPEVTPETFLINPQGQVVFHGMPDDSRRYLFHEISATDKKSHPVPETYLSKALAEAFAGKPITQPPIKDEGCIVAW